MELLRRISKLGKRSLLLISSILLSGLLAEGIARVFFPDWAPRSARLTQLWQYHPRYGWSHIPGMKGRFESFGFDTQVAINSKGFRGPEVSYARKEGVKRVAVMGDSHVWGFGVELDDMFQTRLQELMPDFEVVNLGVSGYSTDQELLLYLDEGRKYKADAVVVVVAGNDFGANTRSVESIIYSKPIFVLRNGALELRNQPVAKTAWVKRAAVWLAWRSYVLTQLHRYLHDRLQDGDFRQSKSSGILEQNPGKRFPRFASEEITARLLQEFKRVTANDRAELLVVLTAEILNARDVADYLAGFDIQSLILGAYLDRRDTALYLPDRAHWSPAGHKIVARALAEKLGPMLPRRDS